MKQGTAVNYEFRKKEPIVEVINPGGAAQLGVMVVVNPTPLKGDRGFMAPEPEAETIHDCGSQGRHK